MDVPESFNWIANAIAGTMEDSRIPGVNELLFTHGDSSVEISLHSRSVDITLMSAPNDLIEWKRGGSVISETRYRITDRRNFESLAMYVWKRLNGNEVDVDEYVPTKKLRL